MLGETISRNGCYGCSHAHTQRHMALIVFFLSTFQMIKTCDAWGSTRLNSLPLSAWILNYWWPWVEMERVQTISRHLEERPANCLQQVLYVPQGFPFRPSWSSWCWVCHCGVRWCWQRLGVMEQGQRQRLHARATPRILFHKKHVSLPGGFLTMRKFKGPPFVLQTLPHQQKMFWGVLSTYGGRK